MSDSNTNNDEKLVSKENLNAADTVNADVDLDDSKAKFINGGKGVDDTAVDIQVPSTNKPFTGLGKDDLMKYATDPFWVRLRWILFILFWVGWASMLAAAIIIIVLAPRCPHRPDLKWYNTEVSYQILAESFQDSDGDGVGDFNGIKSRLNYLEELGVKSLWLNSIFQSDNIDGGNGIVDYKEVDPKFGTMDDFVALTKAMFKKEMRLVVDFIPNHTSRNHTWFQKSQRGEVGYEDYYVWADQDNQWKDASGRSVWEMDTVRNKYYLHQTAKEFPDLNLRNDAVKKEMEDIIRFWVDKGVYGFNIVGAQYLTENENFTAQAPGSQEQIVNFPDNVAVIQEWREILNSLSTKPGREKVLMATFPTNFDRNETLEYFGNENDGLNILPSRLFAELDQTCNAACLDRQIKQEIGTEIQWRGWVFGDCDTARCATRFPGKLGKLMRTAQMLLPGSSYLYYGDEIGMEDGDVQASPAADVYRFRNGGTIRDIFRTPMQWDNTPSANFTTGTPYIPLTINHARINVATEKAHQFDDTYNNLDLFKDLIKLRQQESFQFGNLATKVVDNVLMIHRAAEGFPSYLVVINFGRSSHSVGMFAGEAGTVPQKVMVSLQTNMEAKDQIIDVGGRLSTIPPETAIVFKFVE